MKKILIAFVLTLFVLHCTNDRPLPNGFQALQRTNKGSVTMKQIRAERSGRFWSIPKAGLQTTLLLGSYKDLRSHAIIEFYSFTEIDSGTVVSSTLKLSMSHIYGTGSHIHAQIYPVTTEWTSANVKWSDIENNFNSQQSMGEVNIAWADSVPDSGMVVEASLNPEMIENWISSPDDNNGFVLYVDQSDFMAEFYSVDATSNWATLTVVHKNTDGTQDTTVINSYLRDASLIINNNPETMNQLISDQNSLVVGDVSGAQSLIQFDLSDIPERITLHQAYVILQAQKDKCDAREFGLPISFAMVSDDSSWNIAQLAIDSTRTNPAAVALASADSTVLTTSANIYYLKQIVQAWLADKSKNQGLLLRSSYQGAFISEMYFYSAYADSQFVPILRLTYSEPPAGRFEKP